MSESIAPQAVSSLSHANAAPGLHLQHITLPVFMGKENLDRFLEQITSLLQSSGVAPKYWTTYFKQQVHRDARVYNALIEAEKEHQHLLGSILEKASPDKHKKHFEACLNTLKTKRGKPRDQQIWDLLHQYYTMDQTAKESVSEFANRFMQTQFELEKLVPNIHKFPESKGSKAICNELELIHAFVIKLKPSISKDLVSREFKYTSLQSLIEAAQRFEDHKALVQDKLSATNWAMDVLYSSGYGPTNNMKGTNPNHQGQGRYRNSGHPESRLNYSSGTGNHNNKGKGYNRSNNDRLQATSQSTSRESREAPICSRFNKFEGAYCELPQNKCQNNRLHKCQTCGRWGCKSRNHSLRRPTGRPQAHVTAFDNEFF